MVFIYHGSFSWAGQQRPLCRHVRPTGLVVALVIVAGNGEVWDPDDVSCGPSVGVWRTRSHFWCAWKTYLLVRLSAGVFYRTRGSDFGLCCVGGVVIPSSEAGIDWPGPAAFEQTDLSVVADQGTLSIFYPGYGQWAAALRDGVYGYCRRIELFTSVGKRRVYDRIWRGYPSCPVAA